MRKIRFNNSFSLPPSGGGRDLGFFHMTNVIFKKTRISCFPRKHGEIRYKYNNGFTLIEVIVVIIILGIMAALVVPNLLSHPDKARVAAARSDIRAISNALELYKLDNYSYPSTDQGIEALANKPSGLPEAKNWNPSGYLKKTPTDPWGNPYRYISPGTHGDFDLYSLGADGKEGGEGFNADINSWEL